MIINGENMALLLVYEGCLLLLHIYDVRNGLEYSFFVRHRGDISFSFEFSPAKL